ncbi:carbon storage regulator CsrA [Paenibacillus piri]|uniref:Translational regulator CsrA n=1 Tax=Paenibacillus piri TaxID=2547395 RepID=A0A4R5KE59_9BACL|nr:carbon storage regulator CsrA [Paenibacillus piri]TDF93506.1 carbon storage regulator [Paenibacillus piri]
MLVLSRKKGESIMIGDQIELVILSLEGDNVRIGINAPKQVGVFRKEVFESIQKANQEAANNTVSPQNIGKLIRKKQTD